MSPQQDRGEEVDERDDIYSLGVVLYESLAGHLPRRGEDYLPLHRLNPEIPPALDELVNSCLREDKAYRPSSTTDFLNRFQDAWLASHGAKLSAALRFGQIEAIQNVLSQMTPVEYDKLKKGQKILLRSKLKQFIWDNRFREEVAFYLVPTLRVGTRRNQLVCIE